MSLRAVGEGHISSIVFRSGTVSRDMKISIDEPIRFVTTPSFVPDSRYDNDLFRRKLIELGLGTPFIVDVLWCARQIEQAGAVENPPGRRAMRENRSRHAELEPFVDKVIMLAKSNYNSIQPRP